jgi:hypothetical protein
VSKADQAAALAKDLADQVRLEADDERRAEAILEFVARRLGFSGDAEARKSPDYLGICAAAIQIADIDAAAANRAFLRLLYNAFELRPTHEGLIDILDQSLPDGRHQKWFTVIQNDDEPGTASIKIQPLFQTLEGLLGMVFHGGMPLDEALDKFGDQLQISNGSTSRAMQQAGIAMNQLVQKLQHALMSLALDDEEKVDVVVAQYREAKDEITDAMEAVSQAFIDRKEGRITAEQYTQQTRQVLQEAGVPRKGYNYDDSIVTVDYVLQEITPYTVTRSGRAPRKVTAHRRYVFDVPVDERGNVIVNSTSSQILVLVERVLRWHGKENDAPPHSPKPGRVSVRHDS